MTLHRPAAIYVRLSKDSPDEVSTAAQEKAARNLCEQRGWEVGEVYRDVGVSAFKDVSRPGRERLMRDIEDGVVGAMVVYKLDRFARSLRDFVRMIDSIEEAGCVFASVHDPIDTATPIGRAMLSILAVFAELESEQTRIRQRTANQHRAAAGRRHPGGKRAFGYEKDNITVNEREAEYVRQMAQRFLDGDTLADVARWLNAEGVTTTTGGEWMSTVVSGVLRNPRYAGLRLYKVKDGRGEVISEQISRAEWEPVVDEDTWARLSEAFVNSKAKGRRGTLRTRMLSGIATCGLCGAPMSTNSSTPKARADGSLRQPIYYYVCRKYVGGKSCGRVTVNRDHLDAYVRDVAFEGIDLGRLRKASERTRHRQTLTRLQKLLTADQSSLEELSRDFYVDRVIGREEFLGARGTLVERIRQTEAEVARLQPTRLELPVQAEDIREAWEMQDPETDVGIKWRRTVLEMMFEKVIVNPGKRGLGKFDPNRIDFVWRV